MAPASTARLGLERGGLVALLGDAGDDRHAAVGGGDERADDVELLLLGEERAFAGVAEHDEALHAVDRAEPGAESLDRVVVDVAVFGEGGHRCGVQAAKVESHLVSFYLFVEPRIRNDCGNVCRNDCKYADRMLSCQPRTTDFVAPADR